LTLTTFLEGEAREAGRLLAAIAREVRVHGRPLAPPCCILVSGEPTVHVSGPGRGGRCTELAAGFALGAAGLRGVLLLAAASDGTDGPTDAAGAFADGTTACRGQVADAVARNDTATLFAGLGDLLVTGPTGTNVNDIAIMLVEG
ncbi:MAG: MOFRL family protein, partial [Candidatus Xenobia bacterium]